MKLKCPKCGSTDKFVSNQYVEHHDAVFNGDEIWVEDFECYDAYHDTDGATCACKECGHAGTWQQFQV